MKSLRAAVRLAHAFVHAFAGYFTILLVFPRLTQEARNARVQAWAKRMIAILGLRLRVVGEPVARGPVLLVSNHISWLDIVSMHAARHCRFVSKSEVKDWPLVGRLSTGSGTLYIARGQRRDAHRMVQTMADALRAGDVLAVFPEGTTGDGRTMLPFHANLLQAAIDAPAPVQCVGLRFIDIASGETSFGPSYVGGETLIGSIWRTLCADPIEVRVNFEPPETPVGLDRRELSKILHPKIDRLRMR